MTKRISYGDRGEMIIRLGIVRLARVWVQTSGPIQMETLR